MAYQGSSYRTVGELFDDTARYEDGGMDSAEVIQFFQRLVDTGLAWRLQGHYGRTAAFMLRAGLVRPSTLIPSINEDGGLES